MKLTIEFDIPLIEEVDAPTLYQTPLGEVSDKNHADQIGWMIERLQNMPKSEMQWIIESNHDRIRLPFCKQMIRENIRFVGSSLVNWTGEKLSHFLQQFQARTGYKFSEYKYEPTVLSNSKKFQIVPFTKLFDTREDAIKHAIEIRLAQGEYVVKEEK